MKTLLLLLGAFLTCGALAQDRPAPRPALAADYNQPDLWDEEKRLEAKVNGVAR